MSAPISTGRAMYPPIEPYDKGMLPVTDGHQIYWETSGNPDGLPALFVQAPHSRGSGLSLPFASLENNTTPKLIEDMEALRCHLKIEKWLVFGGSWGSTLGLAYAQAHAARVTHLVLRGIFLLRRPELLFFYQEGSSWLFPEMFEEYLAPIPIGERGDLMTAYYRRLTSTDDAVRHAACVAWATWEGRTSKLIPDADLIASFSDMHKAEAMARIECHYFVNAGFLPEGSLLEKANMDKIRHIPAVIVQGRYDLVCPAKSAYDLHKAWPEATLTMVVDSGHSAFDVGNQKALLDAVDAFRP